MKKKTTPVQTDRPTDISQDTCMQRSVPETQPARALSPENAPLPDSAWQEPEFEIRPYLKKELAKLYFPDLSPEYALKKLRSWIHFDKGLCHRVYDGPEGHNDQCFSSRQVREIVRHLGAP